MNPKYQTILDRFTAIESQLQLPAVMSDRKQMETLGKEYNDLRDVVAKIRHVQKIKDDLVATTQLAQNESEPEMAAVATEELVTLTAALAHAENELTLSLRPEDPQANRNAILEIRPAAGGDEASLFAAELFRMYGKYAEGRGWKVRILDSQRTEVGGLKELSAEIIGQGAFGALRYESGVHRVQRVPDTEKSGRVHTSTVTVVVLPEVEEQEFALNMSELEIEATTATGNGGQSVNTTYSAIRMKHIPTGTMVVCQDERSQAQNRSKALMIMRARLMALDIEKKRQEASAQRKIQIGSGDRSEKIRTYNFPQDRMTDHRIQENWNQIDLIMEGKLQPIIDALHTAALEEQDNSL